MLTQLLLGTLVPVDAAGLLTSTLQASWLPGHRKGFVLVEL